MPTTLRPLLMPVYGAICDLSAMRAELAALREALSETEAAQLLARVDVVEQAALQLLEWLESVTSGDTH
jgi:hypothetical protein